MLQPEIILQLVWTGLANASYACLFAVAFALVLRVNKVWNFGQAGQMLIAYSAMFIVLRWWHGSMIVAVSAGLAATVAASLAIEQFGFRVLRRRRASTLSYFILTLVLSQLIVFVGELVFGTEPTTLTDSIVAPAFALGPIIVNVWDCEALAATVALLLLLYLVLMLSPAGQNMTAVADNAALAELYGIDPNRSYRMSMALSAIFITMGMLLLGTKTATVPSTPLQQYLIASVVATILAGVGNVFSAGFAAFALGLLQSFSILIVASRWQPLVVYGVLAITILLFPRGVGGWQFRLPAAGRLAPGSARAETAR
ncbi:MAG: branched-chain amino acid ABC transporter permease [Alphaproteobacteria bacterium]|nr:branched-chain amino acid ABC transporter permease [Alphaproteobacteria bacterium]